MIPVDQTVFGEGGGNCYAACVASLLDMPTDSVPNLCVTEGDWFAKANGWLRQHGVGLVILDVPEPPLGGPFIPQGCHHIMSGDSPRGDFLHSVVGLDGRMVHDPHPDRAGLRTVRYFEYLVKLL